MKSVARRGLAFFTRRIEVDPQPFHSALCDHPEVVVLSLGIMLRLLVYSYNRSYWFDEATLSANLVGVAPLDFSRQLTGDQLAPFGFLMAERALTGLFGSSKYATRFLPLVGGIAGLCLFASLARRVLSRRPALVALVLLAFSDDMIYYSSELKPYTLDLVVGLAVTLLAQGALGGPATGRQVAALAVFAAVAPWCSFASAFIVAGCGMTLILASLHARRYRALAVWVCIGIAWLASFLVAYRASKNLLSPYTTMYVFWDFAFLPLWPAPLAQAKLARTAGILLEIFVNPLNLIVPFRPPVGVVLPILLFFIGAVALARRSWATCSILLLPVVLAVIASGLKRYPLHGRLILELVPAFFLLIAAGTECLRMLDGTRMKVVYAVILILLLAYPCFSAFYESTGIRPRFFNAHGDLHNNIFVT